MLAKLALALDCEVADLVPDNLVERRPAKFPPFELIHDGKGMCHVRIDAKLPMAAALEIMQIYTKAQP